VNVINTPPSVSGPANFEYVYGSSGNQIVWTIQMRILLLGLIQFIEMQTTVLGHIGVTWTSGSPITVIIDGLAPGLYIFNITVDDGAHINGTHVVNVTIVNTPPTIHWHHPILVTCLGQQVILLLGSLLIQTQRLEHIQFIEMELPLQVISEQVGHQEARLFLLLMV